MGANAQTTVPDFVADTVLTAAKLDISAATGVPVFATTVTRDAAFGGSNKVLAEGQTCYLEDANVVQYYDGAAWAAVGPSGAWTAYTPTLLIGVTVAKTVDYAKYLQVGKTVFVQVRLTATASGTANNVVQVGLPSGLDPVGAAGLAAVIGSFSLIDSGTAFFTGAAMHLSSGIVAGLATNSGTYMGASAPQMTVVSGDFFGFSVMYEVA